MSTSVESLYRTNRLAILNHLHALHNGLECTFSVESLYRTNRPAILNNLHTFLE